jgi:hypothetical protein
MSRRQRQRNAEIGPHTEIRDREVVADARIVFGIRHDQWRPIDDDVLAKRVRQGRLPLPAERRLQALLAFEELPVVVDKGYQRNRHAEQPRYHPCQPVECFFRRRIRQACIG